MCTVWQSESAAIKGQINPSVSETLLVHRWRLILKLQWFMPALWWFGLINPPVSALLSGWLKGQLSCNGQKKACACAVSKTQVCHTVTVNENKVFLRLQSDCISWLGSPLLNCWLNSRSLSQLTTRRASTPLATSRRFPTTPSPSPGTPMRRPK